MKVELSNKEPPSEIPVGKSPQVLLGPTKIFKYIFDKAKVKNADKLKKMQDWRDNCLAHDGFLRIVDYRKQPDLVASFKQDEEIY